MGENIPNFILFFKGKRMLRNYIVHYESNATMAMKPKAWMDNQLFLRIAHFVKSMIYTMDRISLTN
jgi:hypothetical protein